MQQTTEESEKNCSAETQPPSLGEIRLFNGFHLCYYQQEVFMPPP